LDETTTNHSTESNLCISDTLFDYICLFRTEINIWTSGREDISNGMNDIMLQRTFFMPMHLGQIQYNSCVAWTFWIKMAIESKIDSGDTFESWVLLSYIDQHQQLTCLLLLLTLFFFLFQTRLLFYCCLQSLWAALGLHLHYYWRAFCSCWWVWWWTVVTMIDDEDDDDNELCPVLVWWHQSMCMCCTHVFNTIMHALFNYLHLLHVYLPIYNSIKHMKFHFYLVWLCVFCRSNPQ
jgi:hypothetical protein